jgi:hypothetical protein
MSKDKRLPGRRKNQTTASESLRSAVFDALDHARTNGYDDEVYDWEPARLAVDLGTYDATLGGLEAASLIPFIQEWRKNNPKR